MHTVGGVPTLTEQFVPEWNYSVTAAYDRVFRGGQFHASATWRAQDDFNIAGSPPNDFIVEDGYGLLDGRISISPNPDLTFSIWGRNLTDKLYRTNAIAFFGDETSRLGAPRTYGAEISINF